MWQAALHTPLPYVLLYDLQSTFTLNLIYSFKALCGISHYPTFTENAKAQRGLETHPRTPACRGSMGTDPSHGLQFPALFPKTQLPTFMCKIFLYSPNISVHIRAIKTFCIPLSTFMMMVAGSWYSLRHMPCLSTSFQTLLGKNFYQEYVPHTVYILYLFLHDVKPSWELLFINIFLNCLFSYLVVILWYGRKNLLNWRLDLWWAARSTVNLCDFCVPYQVW